MQFKHTAKSLEIYNTVKQYVDSVDQFPLFTHWSGIIGGGAALHCVYPDTACLKDVDIFSVREHPALKYKRINDYVKDHGQLDMQITSAHASVNGLDLNFICNDGFVGPLSGLVSRFSDTLSMFIIHADGIRFIGPEYGVCHIRRGLFIERYKKVIAKAKAIGWKVVEVDEPFNGTETYL